MHLSKDLPYLARDLRLAKEPSRASCQGQSSPGNPLLHNQTEEKDFTTSRTTTMPTIPARKTQTPLLPLKSSRYQLSSSTRSPESDSLSSRGASDSNPSRHLSDLQVTSSRLSMGSQNWSRRLPNRSSLKLISTQRSKTQRHAHSTTKEPQSSARSTPGPKELHTLQFHTTTHE